MAAPLLSLRNIHLRFGLDTPVLRNVSVDIGPAESVAILGKSGAGKSSLLLVASGLLTPDSGAVAWDGEPVESRGQWQALRRNQIGMIFQDFMLLNSLSALENIEVAAVGTNGRSRAVALLDELDLTHRQHQPVRTLSGGEKQRVAIARALINRPSLLIADEPTGSLDTLSSQAITELLGRLIAAHGLSVLLVTHDTNTATVCDRVLFMQDGRLMDTAP